MEEAAQRVDDNAPLYKDIEIDMLARPTTFNYYRIAKYYMYDFSGNKGVKGFYGTIVYDEHWEFWTVYRDATSMLGRTQERLTFNEVI
jgi:hypothetical protein